MRTALLAGGGFLVLLGFLIVFSGFSAGPGDMPNMGAMFFGMACLAGGGALVKFGLVKPVADYVASETSDAVTTTLSAAGRGWRQGAGPVGAPAQVIRLKCRSCGELDSEYAKFCSGCGEAM